MRRSRIILKYAMAANAFVAVPAAIIVGLLSPHIMRLYGKSFEPEYGTLGLAVVIAALVSVQAPGWEPRYCEVTYVAGSSDERGLGGSLCWKAYLLISRGAVGVTLALGAGYIAHSTWTFWFAIHHHNAASKG